MVESRLVVMMFLHMLCLLFEPSCTRLSLSIVSMPSHTAVHVHILPLLLNLLLMGTSFSFPLSFLFLSFSYSSTFISVAVHIYFCLSITCNVTYGTSLLVFPGSICTVFTQFPVHTHALAVSKYLNVLVGSCI